MRTKFTSTIAGASIFITVTLLISKMLGILREAVFANFFGLSNEYDIYLIASVLPVTINTIIFYFAQNYFIPQYNVYKIESQKRAEVFTRVSFWLFLLSGLIIGLILFVFAEDILLVCLNSNISNPLGVELLKITSFSILFYSASSVLSAFLLAELEFKAPALSQLFFNIVLILLVSFFQNQIGVKSIAFGYLGGAILQFLYLIYMSLKAIKIFNIRNIFSMENLGLVKISLVVILVIEGLSQLYLLIDRIFYNQVDPGGIAALNYAFYVYILPLSIFSMAMSTAIFPTLAKSSAENHEQIDKYLQNFFTVNIYLFVPITLIFLLWGEFLIGIIFERGLFNAEDTKRTFTILQIYTPSLIFYSSYAVLNKLLYSKKLIGQLVLIVFFAISIKAVLNIMLVIPYKEVGLAVGTSISYVSFFIFGFIIVAVKMRIRNRMFFFKELIIGCINCFICFLISQILVMPLNLNGIFQHLVQIGIILLIYYLNAVLLNLSANQLLLSTLRSFVRTYRTRIVTGG